MRFLVRLCLTYGSHLVNLGVTGTVWQSESVHLLKPNGTHIVQSEGTVK